MSWPMYARAMESALSSVYMLLSLVSKSLSQSSVSVSSCAPGPERLRQRSRSNIDMDDSCTRPPLILFGKR
ncbi:hypothetical protein POJ06DRAFT_248272 [Lipomyces tetrasporus]|uniref:Secreted protein n=1 Tax=Lipomyces tetrasporus TaxID=54092 RepID=A0AAD7QUW9_9ASCO|nr:uncharacterized protein POJ06DRAFT_248272 [Lipomyces tetrasporus]KAJ8101929.1 hypothetical protein POJ06DRAFT_248272 [Lipomyces tetrasporus]